MARKGVVHKQVDVPQLAGRSTEVMGTDKHVSLCGGAGVWGH